jgi:hypothetical protein
VPRRVRLDLHAQVRVVRRTPLWYGPGADAGLDLGPHVRAASAVVCRGDTLYVIQDDTAAVALISLSDNSVRALPLPAPGGIRRFDERRGNKGRKPDFESACWMDLDGRPVLLAFGSGSSPERESVAMVPLDGASPCLVPLPRLYAAWRSSTEFSGSELNVEGVLSVGDRLWLAQRGNGAPTAGRAPVNATATLPTAAFVALLAAPDTAPVPSLSSVETWELGRLDGARLTFTDLAASPHGVLFAAAAEASPDAVRDGPVAGVVIGRLSDGLAVRVVNEGGGPARDKVEGLTLAGDGRLLAVVDRDDPDAPADLLELELPPLLLRSG